MAEVKPESESQNLEGEIVTFLSERREKVFTSQEIMGGVALHTEFSTPETAKMSTFAIADFTTVLYDMVRRGKVKMEIIRGRMHFRSLGDSAKCPKCKREVAEPRKSWKMAGRPDKKGKRLQLHIGLFDCQKHGAFRKVLGKQKI